MINLRRLKQKIKYNSLLRILHDGLVKVGIKISFFYLVEEGLYKEIPEFELDQFPGYNLMFLDKSDITELSSIPERPVSKEKLLQLMKKGCTCLCLKKEDDLVAFTWINPDECTYGTYKLSMKENEACLFDAYTLIKYRGNNIAPFIRYQCYKELNKIGKNILYSISEIVNKQSINFKKKLGAHFVLLGFQVSLFKKWNYTRTIKKFAPREEYVRS